jgi:hypothetical protein
MFSATPNADKKVLYCHTTRDVIKNANKLIAQYKSLYEKHEISLKKLTESITIRKDLDQKIESLK